MLPDSTQPPKWIAHVSKLCETAKANLAGKRFLGFLLRGHFVLG